MSISLSQTSKSIAQQSTESLTTKSYFAKSEQKSLWNYTDYGEVASKLGSNLSFPRDEALHGSILVSFTPFTPQKNLTSVFAEDLATKRSRMTPPLL